jgi:predicted transcriptional regulator
MENVPPPKVPLYQRILELVKDGKGWSKKELAVAVNKKPSQITVPIQVLISKGLIKPQLEGTSRLYYPSTPPEPPLKRYRKHKL